MKTYKVYFRYANDVYPTDDWESAIVNAKSEADVKKELEKQVNERVIIGEIEAL